MIAELLLIVDLLNKTIPVVSVKEVTPVSYTPDYDYRLMEPKVVPQITKIVQPVVIPDLTPQQIATAYLEASTGRPESITKRIATGRL